MSAIINSIPYKERLKTVNNISNRAVKIWLQEDVVGQVLATKC